MRAAIPTRATRRTPSCGALTSILCGESYATSAEMSRELGPFEGSAATATRMLRVIRNHRRAAYAASASEYEASRSAEGIHAAAARSRCSTPRVSRGTARWPSASGSAIATRRSPSSRRRARSVSSWTAHDGHRADFALVKYKKLAGGGYFKIINQSLPPALTKLGYSGAQIADVQRYVLGAKTLKVSRRQPRDARREGFDEAALAKVEAQLEQAFEISFVFNKWTLARTSAATS